MISKSTTTKKYLQEMLPKPLACMAFIDAVKLDESHRNGLWSTIIIMSIGY